MSPMTETPTPIRRERPGVCVRWHIGDGAVWTPENAGVGINADVIRPYGWHGWFKRMPPFREAMDPTKDIVGFHNPFGFRSFKGPMTVDQYMTAPRWLTRDFISAFRDNLTAHGIRWYAYIGKPSEVSNDLPYLLDCVMPIVEAGGWPAFDAIGHPGGPVDDPYSTDGALVNLLESQGIRCYVETHHNVRPSILDRNRFDHCQRNRFQGIWDVSPGSIVLQIGENAPPPRDFRQWLPTMASMLSMKGLMTDCPPYYFTEGETLDAIFAKGA